MFWRLSHGRPSSAEDERAKQVGQLLCTTRGQHAKCGPTTTTLIEQLKTYLNTFFHVTAQIMRWNVAVASGLRKSRRQAAATPAGVGLLLLLLLLLLPSAFHIYFWFAPNRLSDRHDRQTADSSVPLPPCFSATEYASYELQLQRVNHFN